VERFIRGVVGNGEISCATNAKDESDVEGRSRTGCDAVPEMENRPSGVALQGEAPNHRQLRRSTAGVVSVTERRTSSASGVGQEGERKRTSRDVGRNSIDDIKTGREGLAWDEPGDNLSTAQVVSGMELAQTWSGLWCGTWEPRDPIRSAVIWPVHRPRERAPQAEDTARGRVAMRAAGADRPVVAMMPSNAGGARGRSPWLGLTVNCLRWEEPVSEPKPMEKSFCDFQVGCLGCPMRWLRPTRGLLVSTGSRSQSSRKT